MTTTNTAGDHAGEVHSIFAGRAGDRRPTSSARCEGCGRELELDVEPFESVEPGVRQYACTSCGETTALYSAAWLNSRGGEL